MAGNVTRDLIEKLGVKSLSKGVKVQVEEGDVKVAMNINLNYGFNVPDTCSKIQDKVKTAIETMTGLTVAEVNDTVMFDAPASATAQLSDWTYLGTLYSGGEVDLAVTLQVPVELDNRFQYNVGYLDWEFMVEELPIEASDPKTGDTIGYYAAVMVGSAAALVILLLIYRKRKK